MNMIVARKLHERRFRPCPVLTTGEVLNMIGSEGMQEALERRWLVADMDNGLLTLNLHGGKLLELENACRCHCGKTDCACAEAAEVKPSTMMPMREVFAGPGIPARQSSPAPTSAGQPPAMQVPRTRTISRTPTSPVVPHHRMPQKGDEALVPEGNRTLKATVQGLDDKGNVQLSFTGEQPSTKRDYGAWDLQIVNPSSEQHA